MPWRALFGSRAGVRAPSHRRIRHAGRGSDDGWRASSRQSRRPPEAAVGTVGILVEPDDADGFHGPSAMCSIRAGGSDARSGSGTHPLVHVDAAARQIRDAGTGRRAPRDTTWLTGRIAVDARELGGRPTGVGRYLMHPAGGSTTSFPPADCSRRPTRLRPARRATVWRGACSRRAPARCGNKRSCRAPWPQRGRLVCRRVRRRCARPARSSSPFTTCRSLLIPSGSGRVKDSAAGG